MGGTQQRHKDNYKSDQLHKMIDQRANEATAPSSECLPVPQEILWRKLASDLSSFTRGRTSLTPPDQSSFTRGRTSRTPPAVTKRRLRQKKQRDEKNETQKGGAGLERPRKSNRYVEKDADTKSHQCKFQMRWKRMPDGVFPPFIESGRCSRKPCMMGLYMCAPRKYAITVLKRVPSKCRPLVTTTTNLTNVEVWRFAEHLVTVGCACAKRKRTGVFPSTFTTELSQTTI